MDPQLQAKIDEARSHGYSQEEINSFIASQNAPATQPMSGAPNPYMQNDRSQEHTGLAQAALLQGAGGLGHVIGKGIEYGAPAYAAYRGVQALNNRTSAPTPNVNVQPEAQMNAAQQMSNVLHPDELNHFTTTGNLPQRLGGTGPNAIPQMTQQPPTSQNYIQRMSQLAEQYGGVASKLGAVAKYAGPALMGASVLKDLVYTSPEEIAALKAQEQRKQLGQ